jgi:FixJ family two-component response regulator
MITTQSTPIYVVDSSTSAREDYCRLLQPLGYRVEAFADAESFLKHVDPHTAGCLILDTALPGMSGAALYVHLHSENSPLAVIFSVSHGDIDTAVSLIKRGAVNYGLKPIREQTLLDSINQALRLSQAHLAKIEAKALAAGRLSKLTLRETQVLHQLVAGTHYAIIATNLGITKRTVEAHRRRIMDKLSAKTLPQLLQELAQVGWPSNTLDRRAEAVRQSLLRPAITET